MAKGFLFQFDAKETPTHNSNFHLWLLQPLIELGQAAGFSQWIYP